MYSENRRVNTHGMSRRQSTKPPSRRSLLSLVTSFTLPLIYSLRKPFSSGANSLLGKARPELSLSAGASDLHDIFKGEVLANFRDNVYASLGNKLQLDGESYVQVSRALAIQDFTGILASTPMPEQIHNGLVKEQILKAERAFLDALQSLAWPKYSVSLDANAINTSGPLKLDLYARMTQPIIFSFHNTSLAVQTLHVISPEISVSRTEVTLEPGSTRYVFGSVCPAEKGNFEARIRLVTDAASRELIINASVTETGMLEGLLTFDDEDGEPPIARIRVTDVHGRYFHPDQQVSGLVRMIPDADPTKAERWVYADGKFRVRVPVGKIRVSIRRGLEYRGIDEEIEIKDGGTVEKKFFLRRWTHMEKEGWYPGDTHVHMLDPRTALFEMRAEGLSVVNVLVFRHLSETYARERFSGQLDPISDNRHFVYYNEEYRNEPLGHIGLLNLKAIVEPISTGRLGLHWPTIMRYDSINMPLPVHGDADSPDFPLLVEVMKQTHKQGGLVSWAHLRPSQWEFPLDAEEHQIDFADIMTHTHLPDDLRLWYALLNCGFRIPACAGTDRIEPTQPIGNQRVYVRLAVPLTYDSWMKGLKQGSSFVTNGPMMRFSVNGVEPGGEINLSEPTRVVVSARARSQIPFERLEVVINGKSTRIVNATENGLYAEINFDYQASSSAWVTARCMGAWSRELFYSNPVFAHTNPVHLRYRQERIENAESARYLLGFLRKLEKWVRSEAYFENRSQKRQALRMVKNGITYFEKISRNS